MLCTYLLPDYFLSILYLFSRHSPDNTTHTRLYNSISYATLSFLVFAISTTGTFDALTVTAILRIIERDPKFRPAQMQLIRGISDCPERSRNSVIARSPGFYVSENKLESS